MSTAQPDRSRSLERRRKELRFQERAGEGRLTPDMLAQYLASISGYELLTAEQEVELSQLIENNAASTKRLEAGEYGDEGEEGKLRSVVVRGEEAKEGFVRANLRLVVAIGRRTPTRGGSTTWI